jgi:class 3 adenylate cyclase/CHAT domain-containing protein
MNTDDRPESEPKHGNIEDIMRERERLDTLLHQKFRKRMTIVFTDVCGYTKYMDTRGDIAGRAWMQKHNDIVLPLIEAHQGKVLSLMGDGVLSSFEHTLDAVKACIAIQKGLMAYNKTAESVDELHITIGINTGEILADDDHIAGDTVNVASRIETQAEGDQILISESVYEDIRGSEDIICRKHGAVSVKGKYKALELYRVIWLDEEIVLSVEPRLRSAKGNGKQKRWIAQKVLELEVTRENNQIKISSFEHQTGEVSTIRQYEEVPISFENLTNRCNEVVDTLNACNRKGHLSRNILSKLREIGQTFRDELFTPSVEETFQKSQADHLVIHMDDQLVQVPWELLHDGRQFLCQGFNLGRLVKTRQQISGAKTRLLGYPLKALVLADPGGDLKSAYEEGNQIRDYLERHRDLVNVSFRSQDILSDFVREKIRFFDFVHFAGHADYFRENPGQSGWRLSDGNLHANEIKKMADTGYMPALIFSNACQSARTDEWSLRSHFQDEIFGLANAFILAGVKHYVGTFWEVLDEPSKRFAIAFYRHLFENRTIGEAVRMARLDLMEKYGEETIIWASYLLYGDPTFNYMSQVLPDESSDEPADTSPADEPTISTATRSAPDEPPKSKPKKALSWRTVASLAIVFSLVIWALAFFFGGNITKLEDTLVSHYQAGDYENALIAAETLKKKDHDARLAYLISADIHLRKGDANAAQSLYQQALVAEKGSPSQFARALIGLGRIASLQKKEDKALDYYRQAADASPVNGTAFLSQAMLLDKRGDTKNALSLLEKASRFSSENQSIAAFRRELQIKAELAADEKKQERIDKLVTSLVEGMDKPSRALPSDGWTSQPLTLWIIDFTTRGYSLREGEDTLLVAGMTDFLLQHGQVQIVERALLDKLLTELKLSTTKLTDQRTALALGKLLAARLIITGKLVYSGPHTQVSLRMFETETGRITAALNESVGSAVPLSAVADLLTKNLIQQIENIYPIRGKIEEISGDTATLNIGSAVGVMSGQTFKVAQQDSLLKVDSVMSDKSMAGFVHGQPDAAIGQRVEIVKTP